MAEELPGGVVILPEQLPFLGEHIHVLAQVGDRESVQRHDAVATFGFAVRVNRLARDNHPDKLMAQGLPHEFVALANEKLATINAAYDKICKERGVN